MQKRYYDVSLFSLAYCYLKKKHRRDIYVHEILETCEKILQKIEMKNRQGKIITIRNNRFELAEK